MEKYQLKDDLQKINKYGLVTEAEVVMWLGRSHDFVRTHVLHGIEKIRDGRTVLYASEDIVNAIYAEVYGNRKFRGKVDKVNKSALTTDIKETFGCSFVSASEVAKWMGRSLSYVSDNVLKQTPSYGNGKRKLYFVGDVVNRLLEMRSMW